MKALALAVETGLPRLLTLCDRTPLSPAHGSCDRPFWLYRSDKDYPSGTAAQACWPLALLASDARLGAPPALRPRLGELALAAMAWWARVQHRDGSLDEWFAFERSHVATAFTAFAVAEAGLALGERFAASPERARVAAGLARAARWLAAHEERAVANHAAGAAAALASVEALLPGAAPPGSAARALAALLALEDEEGFFPEYGGADPGYATVTLAFLAHAARRLPPSPDLEAALARLAAFAAPFANPDGSYGGEHGRRATRYAWLSGFALLAPRSPVASGALARLLAGLERASLPSPSVFDDRYFVFFAYPDAVAALQALRDAPAPASSGAASVAPPDDLLLPRAGLAVLRSPALHAVVGGAVGGALKAWAQGRLIHDDCGYAGRLADGTLVSSWRHGAHLRLAPGRAACEGDFSTWTREGPLARHPLLVPLFTRTLGRHAALGGAAARWAKRRFTSAPGRAPLRLARSVELEGARLVVRDAIALAPGARVETLRRVAAFAPVHVPSAPLWLPAFEPLLPPQGPELAPLLTPGRALEVTTTLELERGEARLRVEAAGRELDVAAVAIEAP